MITVNRSGGIELMKKIYDIKAFTDNAANSLVNIVNSLNELPSLDAKKFSPENTAVVIIDMVNGFAKCGALSSERVMEIIPDIENLLSKFKDFTKLFIAEGHNKNSREFNAYPEHCVLGTEEAEIVSELKPFIDDKAIICRKNSTNGFLSKQYTDWLMKNPQITNLIVVGDCTDLCISQFCLTQVCFWHERDIDARVIIPVRDIETYNLDANNHNADLMNVFALYNMQLNGVELVSEIK